MLILIEDTERGMDVAKGIWGAFTSCLYFRHSSMKDMPEVFLVDGCHKCGVDLIIISDKIDELRDTYRVALTIHCDGGNIEDEDDKTLIFNKADKRDSIVTLIITYLKRKKLL